MALPGVVAGSLLTFIPAVGDFVNAELLGNPKSQMIGNIIEAKFLKAHGLPGRAPRSRSRSWPRSSSRCSSTPASRAPSSSTGRRPDGRRPRGSSTAAPARARPAHGIAVAALPARSWRAGRCPSTRSLAVVYLALPVLVMIAVQLQRPDRPREPHLAGLLASMPGSTRWGRSGLGDAVLREPRHRGPVDAHRDHHRACSWRSRWCATRSAGGRPPTCSCSCPCPRPRSCSAPRC